ncbi:MAG: hypothetical protein KJ621_16475 [Proteobacteria bacterium]|nr:hypothetical protein [Pseudomonadota bacterium]
MTRWLSIGAAAIIAGLCLLNWIQEKRIEKLTVRVTQYQAATYSAWRDIDHATSKKIMAVVGGTVQQSVNTLNELFGHAQTVPPAPGPAKPAGQAKPPVRGP